MTESNKRTTAQKILDSKQKALKNHTIGVFREGWYVPSSGEYFTGVENYRSYWWARRARSSRCGETLSLNQALYAPQPLIKTFIQK